MNNSSTDSSQPAASPAESIRPLSGSIGPLAGNLLRDPTMDAWGAWFVTAARLQTELDARLKRDAGISLVDFNMLMALAEAPAHTLRMSELASAIAFSAPRLNYRVAQAVEAGWVLKTACAEDKRAHNVTLRQPGMEVFVRAGRMHREQIRQVFDPVLHPGDAEVLVRVSREVEGRLGR
ncbi:MarR family transcriptional regulator [Brevibacterium sp. 91QC2O2]|uniref:MarR family winged helix-turn-helix transcriptional regulator n=1 Tax=Brevibacterium sp. 91QC2O2 TaxID=2968458 RepID=UPI00211C2AA3|nr:MarR family transcriptional regulator [Brevibacterium sp. 91QC2O2]MCQ9367549.1 MarR family transcriptional regulator [Brevibacterium sp. 91QC2O2]